MPVRSVLTDREGDAVALARAFRTTLGCEECYVADLDAITGGSPQAALVTDIAGAGSRLLVDAGASTPEGAGAVLAAGTERVVVGLETLASFDALAAIVRTHGCERVVFSLDLLAGTPLVHPSERHVGRPGVVLARAIDAGVTAVVVIDLARVGASAGVDLELCREIRQAYPTVELLAGGGIGGPEDLAALAAAGCDGALVASALHDGRLDAASLARVREPHSSDSR